MNDKATHSISKQSILKRMLRFAANYFGVKRIELLDPLVVLFIEALAEEVYTVSSEINNIETRMLNNLAGIIAPDGSLLAHPAHCIFHALPHEGQTMLSKNVAFILKDKKQRIKNQDSLTFYPLCNTHLHNGGIRYISFNGLLYHVDEYQSQTLISRSRNTVQPKSVWIGLELDESIPNLKDLSFYIDFSGISNKKEILQLLPYSTWKVNGRQINVRQGLSSFEEESINETVKMFNDFTAANNLNKSIWDYYSTNFITICDTVICHDIRTEYPEEFKSSFPPHIFEDLTSPMIWFEVEFPSKISMDVLENMSISINAFPIINKNIRTKTLELQKSLSIIPLWTGNHESLLSIESVLDSEGCIYAELPYPDTDTERFGTYSLRRGGYERYSKREMREYFLQLIKQLENASSVENETQNEKETSNKGALQIHKLLKHIKDLTNKSKEKLEIQYYISIDELKKDDVFFVKYQTTNCELANNIKQYTLLDYENTDILLKPSSLFTLSATSGGKSAPSVSEVDVLQIKALTTRTMLVTDNDIIEFCNKKFNSLISHVEVAKGVMEDPNNRHELLRTKDILLTPRQENGLSLKESDIQLLLVGLKSRSPEMFNYRIKIKQVK